MRRIALAAGLLFAAAALGGVARSDDAHAVGGQPAAGDSITVTGNGAVASVPTTAVLALGVDVRAATATAALAADADAMRKVIAAVEAAGGRQVQTQSVSLSQAFGQNGEPTGYEASNTVAATVEVERAGAVIDAAVAADANQVSGPTLSAADQAKLYRQALEAAMTDARLSAETLAAAAGRTLGRVTSVVEGGGVTPLPVAAHAAASDLGTPIQAGTQQTTANVTVTFALA